MALTTDFGANGVLAALKPLLTVCRTVRLWAVADTNRTKTHTSGPALSRPQVGEIVAKLVALAESHECEVRRAGAANIAAHHAPHPIF